MSEGLRAGRAGDPSGGDESYASRIDRVGLPDGVEPFVAAYEETVGHRDRFVWKWVNAQFDRITLPTVPAASTEQVRETKLLLTLYVTTADDLVEVRDDRATFEAAREIVRDARAGEPGSVGPTTTDADEAVVAFFEEVWRGVETRLASAPRGAAFREPFEYDLRQVWNAIDYSRVVNDDGAVANADELRRYDTHNMVLFPYTGVDLMHSPSFDRADLGALRSLLWQLQLMARIGNWLSTWERELAEEDYASGVVVRAVERGLVDLAEDPSAETLESRIRQHDVEDELVAEWERARETARTKADQIDCFDASQLVDGMCEVFDHHLASAGLK